MLVLFSSLDMMWEKVEYVVMNYRPVLNYEHYQTCDVAGLLEHVVTGLRAASGKNHLPRKQDFRPAGKALQKMKS